MMQIGDKMIILNATISEGLLGVFFFKIIIETIFILFFIFSIIFIPYILFCVGLMKIAKGVGEKPYLAWIPIINLYLIGKIGINKNWGLILTSLGFMILITIFLINIFNPVDLTIISQIIGMLLASILLLSYIALHHIYDARSRYSHNMTIFTVLSFGLLTPFFIFAIRNNPVKTLIK